jgi:hypothetical protein
VKRQAGEDARQARCPPAWSVVTAALEMVPTGQVVLNPAEEADAGDLRKGGQA